MDAGSDEENEDKTEKKSSDVTKKRKRADSTVKERAQEASEIGKEEAENKGVGSCQPPRKKIRLAAEVYAKHRTESKGRFLWDEVLPEIAKEDQPEVRRYAKANLMEKVPMVTVKDRNGEDIKCPVFPKKTVIAEVILPKAKWDDSDHEQFKYLDEYVKENLKDELPGFSPVTRIYKGKKYTWHHHQDEGKMQLVENGIHSSTQHSGGREIWAAERTTPFDTEK